LTGRSRRPPPYPRDNDPGRGIAWRYQNLKFNFITDIAPVATLYRNAPSVAVVNPSFPAKTLPEFIAYARANPGKINIAHAGVGSGPHIYGELFEMMAGVNLVGVPPCCCWPRRRRGGTDTRFRPPLSR